MELRLEEVVSLFSKQPSEFVATLKDDNGDWKPDAWEIVKQGHKEFMGSVTERYESRLSKAEQEKGRAVRERMTKLETKITPVLEKYGVEKSDVLEENLEKLVVAIEGANSGKKPNLNDEDIVTLPIFKTLVRDGIQNGVAKSTAELQEKYSILEKEHTSYKSKVETEKISGVMFRATEKYLDKFNAKIDRKDAEIREAQITSLNKLIALEHKVVSGSDGNPAIVDENGEPLIDKDTFQPITYGEVVKQKATILFGLHQFDPDKSSPGATSQTTPTSQRTNVPVPKTFEEFNEVMKKEQDADKRKAIMEAFEATTKAAEKK